MVLLSPGSRLLCQVMMLTQKRHCLDRLGAEDSLEGLGLEVGCLEELG